MSKTTWIALLSFAVLPGFGFGDDRDETGRIKPYYERTWGEPLRQEPGWTKGRGYWDKDVPYGATPPGYRSHRLPVGYRHSYNPPPNWRGDPGGTFDPLEARRERLKDLRERQLRLYRDRR